MQWSGRCRVHQLPDCIGNPPPHRRAGTIAIQGQLLHPYRAFCRGLIAVAFQHQVGDAPDVDLGDHARKSYRSNLYLRLKRKKGQTREIGGLRGRRPRPYIEAMRHLDLSTEEAGALVALLTRTIAEDRYPPSPRVRALKSILAKLSVRI